MDPSVDVNGEACGPNRDRGEVQVHESGMEAQAQLILSRIHRLQGRQCQRHIQKHVQAFVKHEQTATGLGCQTLRLAKERREPNGRFSSKQVTSVNDEKVKIAISNHHDGAKGTSALVNLVKKIETSGFSPIDSRLTNSESSVVQENQSSIPFNVNSTQSPFLEPSLHHLPLSLHQTSPAAICTSSNLQPNAPENLDAIDCTVGTLKCNLHHLETDYDSDATDSSSGGDSCDESSRFNSLPPEGFPSNTSSPSTPSFSRKHQSSFSGSSYLRESVAWKWVVERGAIAARWMWLFAQVADLEFKIRQQNEMYRTLRQSKGPIVLEASAPVPTATSIPGEIQGSSQKEETPESDPTSQCVRTMPLRPLRKRRLVRAATALAGATRKIARYSTVQCSCSALPSFVSPCLLCNGRYSYVQVIDTDCMPQLERIALLDSSCHPVISLPNQIPLGLHFAKYLKRVTVQKSWKNHLKSDGKRKSTSNHDINNKLLKDQARKGGPKKSQATISSDKVKKKYDSNVKRRTNNIDHPPAKRSKGGRERHESSSNGSLDGNFRVDSSPLPVDTAPRRRRSELQHAFDINNIVIPYSIASTTRVEKLQYKEILTPKWREIDFDQPQSESDLDGLLEDLSEATFLERHRKCEIEEKKRFLTFLTPASQLPGAHRGRGMARCDSKCEPPTGNGFGPVNEVVDPIQEASIVTANNSTHLKDLSKSSDFESQIHGAPARAYERRRTTSSSRRDDSIDEDQLEVAPFEKRTFPLVDLDLEKLDTNDFEEPLSVPCPNGIALKQIPTDNGLKPVLAPSPTKETISHPSKEQEPSLPATPRSEKSLSVSVSGLSASPSSGETDADETEDPEWGPEVA